MSAPRSALDASTGPLAFALGGGRHWDRPAVSRRLHNGHLVIGRPSGFAAEAGARWDIFELLMKGDRLVPVVHRRDRSNRPRNITKHSSGTRLLEATT